MAMYSKAGRRYFGTARRDARKFTDDIIDDINNGMRGAALDIINELAELGPNWDGNFIDEWIAIPLGKGASGESGGVYPYKIDDIPTLAIDKKEAGRVKKFEIVNKLYCSHRLNIEIVEFYNNPAEQILWSDFVISRGGALSLSEISSMRRGALIIPLPTSIDNHQFHNAKSIEKIGMCVIHEQKDGQEQLINKLTSILENKTYIEWKKIENKNHHQASKIIVTNVEKDLQI